MTKQSSATPLSQAVAKVVRSAVGGLNHTNIGYAPGHDHLADPYVDEIMQLFDQELAKRVEEARIKGGLDAIENIRSNKRYDGNCTDCHTSVTVNDEHAALRKEFFSR